MVGIAHGPHTTWLSGWAQTWTRGSADAVCQQMSCGPARSFASIPAELKEDVWSVTYSCPENATSLFSCRNTSVPPEQRGTVATVTCSGNAVACFRPPRQLFCGCFLSGPVPSQA